MRIQDIVIGESYRHKDNPNYCFAKVIKILRPKEGENTLKRTVVKCDWSQNKDDVFGLIKYFSPSDLMPNVELTSRDTVKPSGKLVTSERSG